MFTQALLVGLVLFGVWFVEKCLTTPMVFRPLVVGTLVGYCSWRSSNGC